MELATPPQSPQPKNARLSDVVRKARKRPASAKKTFQSPLEKRSLESHSDVKPWVREAAVAEYVDRVESDSSDSETGAV